MKFTLSWLKDHLDTDVALAVLAERLSSIGLEVESIEDPAAKLGAFTIARVIEAKRHPNADKLQVAMVEIAPGAPPVEVVCGAPNCRTGMVGVFAPLGSFIPGTGITLEKKPVRGVVSNGMLCSERELELSDDHAGIIDLASEYAARVGDRYVDVLDLADPVIEVKLTPNRPDCTGVRGIARDLAACGLGTLKPDPALKGVEGRYDCPVPIALDFPAGEEAHCPAFHGRYIRGVRNGPAPAWLKKRLEAIGLRSINALVDVTNYISMDRGRPLHVYDADKLTGTIRARLGRDGESFQGLDGREHPLHPTQCVIADDARVLGFGGILGGEESATTEESRNILIECAYFDPMRTAAAGRKAGIQTDARYRFERGVDPEALEYGLDIATRMMLDLAGGEPSRALRVGKAPRAEQRYTFPLALVEKHTGLALPAKEIVGILERLGFTVVGKGDTRTVTAPSWRPDVHGTADLIEEVVRIAGLDRVPSTPLPRLHGVTRSVLTERQRRVRRVRRSLASRGMVEAVTWSFIGREQAVAFGGGAEALELANPISSELTSMRPGLLPGLLMAAERNRNRGFEDMALFEVGQAYRGDRPEDQITVAAGIRTGSARLVGSGRHWDGEAREVALADAKADAVALLASLGFDAARTQTGRDVPAWYHPGRSATLRLGPKAVLAHVGVVHPKALAPFGLEGRTIVAFEVFLDAVPAEKRKSSRAKGPLPSVDLLPVKRDLAFVLDEAVPAGDVVKAAAAADKALVTSVGVFDRYQGAGLGEGKKSIAIEVTLQPTERTMTDAEIDAVVQRIVAGVGKATGGVLRG